MRLDALKAFVERSIAAFPRVASNHLRFWVRLLARRTLTQPASRPVYDSACICLHCKTGPALLRRQTLQRHLSGPRPRALGSGARVDCGASEDVRRTSEGAFYKLSLAGCVHSVRRRMWCH